MGVSLQKGQSVSLEKKNTTYSNVSINLKWNQGEKKKSFLGLRIGTEKTNIDLDLGCLYEMKNGQKGCVQALGKLFGSLNDKPYMQLASDDRTGESKDGEFLTINGNQWDQIKRVLVYAFIYEGVSSWSKADGIIHLKSDVSEIDIALDNPRDGQNMCAIALLENVDGKMVVTKLNEYYSGHEPMDHAHSWGLNWVSGRK
jgi:tellurite resistance protein TerA